MTTCPGLGKVTPSPGLMVSMSTPISLVVRVFRVRSNGAWMSDEKYLLRHVRSLSSDESSCNGLADLVQANSLPKTVFQSSNLTAQLKGQGWSGELTNNSRRSHHNKGQAELSSELIHSSSHRGAVSRASRAPGSASTRGGSTRHTSSIARGIDASHRPSPHVRTGTRATQRRLFRKIPGVDLCN